MEDEKTILLSQAADENITKQSENIISNKSIWKSPKFIIAAALCIIAVIVAITIVITSAGGEDDDIIHKLETAQKYLTEMKYEEAKALFEEVIESDPKCEEAYIGLADSYMGLGDEEKAMEVLEEAMEKLGETPALKKKLDEIKQQKEEKDKEKATTAESETTEEQTETEPQTQETSNIKWLVEPEFICNDIIAVKDILPQGREEVYNIGDYKDRVFYYVNDSSGLMGYDGKIYIDSSIDIETDWFNGLVSQNNYNKYNANGEKLGETGGGGSFSLYWNEYSMLPAHAGIGSLENTPEVEFQYVIAAESISFNPDEIKNQMIPEAQHNGVYRLIGKDGKLLTDEKYEDVKRTSVRGGFTESIVGDYAAVKKNGKWGYVNCSSGEKIIDYIYEDAYPFYDGIAAVKKDGKAGFIYEDGTVAMDFIFEETRSVNNGKAWVKKDGKWGVISIGKAEVIEDSTENNNNSNGNANNREMMLEAAKKTISGQVKGTDIYVVTYFDLDMDGTPELYFCPGIAGDGRVWGTIYKYSEGAYTKTGDFDFGKAGEYYQVYESEDGYIIRENHSDGITTMIKKREPSSGNMTNVASKEEVIDGGNMRYYDANENEITKEKYEQLLLQEFGNKEVDVHYEECMFHSEADMSEAVEKAYDAYYIK